MDTIMKKSSNDEAPKTADELRREIVKIRLENERLKEEREGLRKEERILSRDNSRLERKIIRLQEMLKITLDFCLKVRESFLGRALFARIIDQVIRQGKELSGDLSEYKVEDQERDNK